ncbi:MAG TPA: hypothetical protein VGO92_12875 [Acidimicrobiales bacterium]|jgi:succinyl-CoA synthetase beta subunit|nr:hypothetical protein [Acidimicrobiales bacterium]
MRPALRGDTMMAMATKAQTSWAVRNRTGQVVVIFDGRDAKAAAEEWAGIRGYRIESVAVS